MSLSRGEFAFLCGEKTLDSSMTNVQRADKFLESPNRASMSQIAYLRRLGRLLNRQIPTSAFRSKTLASWNRNSPFEQFRGGVLR
eukprot:5990456-Heterocapsa_arctica.AAC.1